jgi:hypothetical protein
VTESDVSAIPQPELRAMVEEAIRHLEVGHAIYVAFLDKVIHIKRLGPNSVHFRWVTPEELKPKPEVRKQLNHARQMDGQTPTTCNDCLLVVNPHACWLRARHNMKLYCGWMDSTLSTKTKIERVKVNLAALELMKLRPRGIVT